MLLPESVFLHFVRILEKTVHFHTHYYLTSFCNYDGVPLLRGTSGIFMYNSDLSQSETRQAMFDVLLTVHLSIILVINQLNAQILVS